jgi:hypothetical protein
VPATNATQDMAKRILAALSIALATSAWAQCTTHAITANGRVVTCTA